MLRRNGLPRSQEEKSGNGGVTAVSVVMVVLGGERSEDMGDTAT